ncbi:MAG: hypothetical protein OXK74_03460, partial [Gemmatimonadota bacterium]|nr:hypothetical protein [Gemmatimonadota bacterium]
MWKRPGQANHGAWAVGWKVGPVLAAVAVWASACGEDPAPMEPMEPGPDADTLETAKSDPEHAVLDQFYFSTNGDDWTNNDGWDECCDLGSRYGVEVDSAGRVVGIDLRDNNLEGRIGPGLGDLEYLRYLFLSDNELQGSIPTDLGDLTRLTRLGLGDNELTGSIPTELGDL